MSLIIIIALSFPWWVILRTAFGLWMTFAKSTENEPKTYAAKRAGQFMEANLRAVKPVYIKTEESGKEISHYVITYEYIENGEKKYKEVEQTTPRAKEKITFCYLNKKDLHRKKLMYYQICDERSIKIFKIIDIYCKYLIKKVNLDELAPYIRQNIYQTIYLKEKRQKNIEINSKLSLTYHKTAYDRDILGENIKNWEYIEYISDRYIKRSYKKENKEQYHNEPRVAQLHYYFSKPLYRDDKRKCPHCGNEEEVKYENGKYLESKCSYCNTILDESENDYKLDGVLYWEDIYYQTKLKKIGKILIIPMIIVTIINILALKKYQINSDNISGIINSSFLDFGMLFLYLVLAVKSYAGMKKPNFENVINKIKEYNCDFIETKFYMNIKNKLQSIHYSDSLDEVALFTSSSCEIPYSNYKNIIDCNIVIIEPLDFRIEGEYQLINCKARVNNFFYEKNKVNNRYEDVEFTVRKDKENKNNTVSETELFHCKNCGSPIDKLSNGRCSYCNTKIDITKHDWEIISYQAKEISNYKA